MIGAALLCLWPRGSILIKYDVKMPAGKEPGDFLTKSRAWQVVDLDPKTSLLLHIGRGYTRA